MTDYATWPLLFGESTKLDLACNQGSIEVLPVIEGESPRIEAHGKNADHLRVESRMDGDTLHVEIDNDEGRFRFSFGRWNARVVVYVPAEIQARMETDLGGITVRDLGPCELDLSTDAGRLQAENIRGRLVMNTDAGQIRLHNIDGSVDAQTDGGQVHLDGVRGRMVLSTDAGHIKGERLSGSVEAETDAGAIHLSIDALDPGEHNLSADLGSIKVELAPDLDVRVETRAGLGSVRNSYPSRPDAPAVLRVSTDVGSVRVRPAGADNDHDHDHDEHAHGRAHAEVRVEHRWGGVPVPPPPPPAPAPPPPPPPPVFAYAWGNGEEREVEVGDPTPASNGGRRPSPTHDEIERILRMVEAGELSAREANDLLRALERE
ncbi:MAG: DUF4097 family beta strand repeat-containing protein [Dehalococcoidia bacterium]